MTRSEKIKKLEKELRLHKAMSHCWKAKYLDLKKTAEVMADAIEQTANNPMDCVSVGNLRQALKAYRERSAAECDECLKAGTEPETGGEA